MDASDHWVDEIRIVEHADLKPDDFGGRRVTIEVRQRINILTRTVITVGAVIFGLGICLFAIRKKRMLYSASLSLNWNCNCNSRMRWHDKLVLSIGYLNYVTR